GGGAAAAPGGVAAPPGRRGGVRPGAAGPGGPGGRGPEFGTLASCFQERPLRAGAGSDRGGARGPGGDVCGGDPHVRDPGFRRCCTEAPSGACVP
ncbi:unnamed protein product, partial [Heterosigma akashiwo]